jgi:hypothetical protein
MEKGLKGTIQSDSPDNHPVATFSESSSNNAAK